MTTTPFDSFDVCMGCPAPISCNIRSACDRQPTVEMQVENAALSLRVTQLQAELNNANGALIASRELVRQLNATVDRLESARAYATTKAFHAQQSRGVSIPAAELAVTEQEDEAFKAIAPRSSTEIRLGDLEQRIDALHKATQACVDEMAANFNLSIVRIESVYMTQQGRINSAHDRLDAIKDAA